MIVRFIAVTLLGWMLGFAWFAIFLPQPLDGRQTDAIVVLTGGAGRINRGLSLLQDGAAGLRRHPLPEAVPPLPSTHVGLIGPFHESSQDEVGARPVGVGPV